LETAGGRAIKMTATDQQLEAILHGGDIDAVKELIAKGADLNAVAEDGNCIFTEAIKFSEDLEYIRDLLKLGAKADVPDCPGATPLVLAVWSNHFLLVRMLLQAGANPNTIAFKDDDPTTAYDAACDELNIQDTVAERMNLEAILELIKEAGGKSRNS
jgi:ankyrin repeat protein